MAIIGRISKFLSVAAGVLLAVVALLLVADIANRFITNRSLRGVIEYSEVIMVALAYLAFPYAERVESHIRVNSITALLPRNVGRAFLTVGYALAIVTVWYFTWVTADQAWFSYQIGEYRLGTAQVPIWPARVAIPLSLFFVGLELVFTLVRRWQTADVPTERVAPTDAV